MRSERGLSTILHCLQWYKHVLRTRLSTPAVQYPVRTELPVRSLCTARATQLNWRFNQFILCRFVNRLTKRQGTTPRQRPRTAPLQGQ